MPVTTNTTGVRPSASSATTPSETNTAIARLMNSTLASTRMPTPRRSPSSRRSAIVLRLPRLRSSASVEGALQLDAREARRHEARADDVAEHQRVEAGLLHRL